MTKYNQYSPQTMSHPGATLSEKLEELGMGPKEFAVRANKPEKTVTAILKGESSITPDMAILFENVLHIPAHFWLERQRLFDEAEARTKSRSQIQEEASWAKHFPLADMIKQGWLPQVVALEDKVSALLKFFRISNSNAWEDYYFNQQLKVDFRISLHNTKESHAISAWLRQGEISAESLEAKEYDEKKFKHCLTEIKKIMADHPADFFVKLQNCCLSAGVKVVHTPCLPKAPIAGSTRWINDFPLIQLSGRYKRNDSFWFTFFHEAGHIFLHGKKDIFLEEVDYNGKDSIKEKEADLFAVNWTFSEEEEEELNQYHQIDEDLVEQFAKKFGTHPAMIIGRLRLNGIKGQTFGQKFIQPIELSNK